MNARKEQQHESRLPETKSITEIFFLGDPVRVQDGLGQRGDIILLGPRPAEWSAKDKPVVYVRDDTCIISSSRREFIRGQGDYQHGYSSCQIHDYLVVKGVELKLTEAPQKIVNETIRVEVSLVGPDKKITLEGRPDNPKAQKVANALVELGVDKDIIVFDPTGFLPR